jgi:intradiol ring-cleaving dioxygenase-like protein
MSLVPSFPWQPSRREFSCLALAAPWLARLQGSRAVQKTDDGEPQTVAPPGAPSAAESARIAELGAALASGTTSVDALLSDPRSDPLRRYPAFRDLIAKHAPTGRVVMSPKGEPGEELHATVRVLDAGGKPYAGARVYAYHTSSRGWYAAEAPHVSGNAGDYRYARLFAHGVCDADGRCELVTIHPAGYPRSELPSHIHLALEGRPGETRGTEIRFEDCPRMTPAMRAESMRAGYVVAPVVKDAGGRLACTAEFRLPG